MQRIAANKVLIKKGLIVNNGVVTLDEKHQIIDLFSLDDCQTESAGTKFYNGLITTDIKKSTQTIGSYIPNLIDEFMQIGYKGKLLLWEHVNLSDLIITPDIKITEL